MSFEGSGLWEAGEVVTRTVWPLGSSGVVGLELYVSDQTIATRSLLYTQFFLSITLKIIFRKKADCF